MLKQRVITALIMVSVFAGVLIFLPWQAFAVLAAGVFLVGAWEWAPLAGIHSSFGRIAYSLSTTLLGGVVSYFAHWGADSDLLKQLLIGGCAWWAVALLWIQGYPSSTVLWSTTAVRVLMGWLVLIPAWLGCLYLRSQEGGAWLILIVVLAVACADIGAYFAGRTFGKRKLAVSVSPGKSWEGVWGGLVAASLFSFVIYVVVGAAHWWVPLVIILPSAMISVVGDLLESMLKRHTGIKDSSQLLPGHGGVLDRIDGLVAAVPVFTLAYLSAGWSI